MRHAITHVSLASLFMLRRMPLTSVKMHKCGQSTVLRCTYTYKHRVCKPVCEHDVCVISTGFANCLQTVCCKPSSVGFFEEHNGCSRLNVYRVRLNFCSPSCLQEDFPISPAIFTWLPAQLVRHSPLVCRKFVEK